MPLPNRILPLVLIATVLAAALVIRPVPAGADGEVLLVNTAEDTDDGACDSQHCSLREAIRTANEMSGPQEIHFDILSADGSPVRISLCQPLPIIIDDGTRIDGTTQPGYEGAPLVIVEPGFTPSEGPIFASPNQCSSVSHGFWIQADGTQVLGLSLVAFDTAFSQFNPAAIIINSGSGNVVEANYIGFEPNGTVRGNRIGVLIGSAGQRIQHNVISGNGTGVHLAAPDQIVHNNLVGTDPEGETSLNGLLGNRVGIRLAATAPGVLIGGPGSEDGNVISGNGTGIEVLSDDNLIQGNRIGLSLTGAVPVRNGIGIEVLSNGNSIGGAAAGEGNVISGNGDYGISLRGDDNFVQGNLIGTDPGGTAAVGNGNAVLVGGSRNLIGGSSPGEGNLISGNGNGIGVYQADHTSILGNLVGTDVSGETAVGNLAGIWVDQSTQTTIGSEGAGNTIAFNEWRGVEISSGGNRTSVMHNVIRDNGIGVGVEGSGSVRNTIRMNEMYDNAGLGIDLGVPGVTENDPGDADDGPNTLLNFPEFDVADGVAEGTACSGCLVDFYIADGDDSGYGEGQTYLTTGTADASGNFEVSIADSLTSPIGPCGRVTATATDVYGNTSEFSANELYGFCWHMDLPIWVAVFVIPVLVGAAGGAVVGGSRRRRLSILTGGGIGILVGAILGIGARFSPNVVLTFLQPPPAEEPPAPESLPPCDSLLDPTGFSPADGAVFETYEDPLLQWQVLQPASEALDSFRVELLGPEGIRLSRETEETSLQFSAFGLLPNPGSRYGWQVVLQQTDDAGRMVDLCTPGRWKLFQMGELPVPGEPPWTPETLPVTPEPVQTCEGVTVVITALQDLNCRQGTSQLFPIRGTLFEGAQAVVQALNPSLTWAYIENPSSAGSYCWVWMGQAEITEGDPACAPTRADPEPPAATPSACRRELPQDQCLATGGTWTFSAAGAPFCTCPP